MQLDYADTTRGHVSQLTEAAGRLTEANYDVGRALSDSMDKLGTEINRQGIGVSLKLDGTAVMISQAVGRLANEMNALNQTLDQASTTSDRVGRRIVTATWALVVATLILALVAAFVR